MNLQQNTKHFMLTSIVGLHSVSLTLFTALKAISWFEMMFYSTVSHRVTQQTGGSLTTKAKCEFMKT